MQLTFDPAELRDRIALTNYHQDDLRTLRVFTVSSGVVEALRNEIATVVEARLASVVLQPGHVTNWTKPYGDARQWSLYNTSGKTEDTSTDHNMKTRGKRTTPDCPQLAELCAALPGLLNMRLNLMGPQSGLSPHEEHIVQRVNGRVGVRLRFHLPLATGPRATMMLDGHVYEFPRGGIYFFNNGCVHGSRNERDETRIHLVWDMLGTEAAFQRMFVDGQLFHAVDRVNEELTPIESVDCTEYEKSTTRLPYEEFKRTGVAFF